MPELKAGEAAVCESKFACEVVVEVEITEPAGGKPTALVAGVNATLRLNVVIWLPIDTTPKIRVHEDGHRQISELFYARGEKTANELARRYLGRSVEISAAGGKGEVPNATPAITRMAHEFCQEYLGAIEVPSQVAQEEYDRLTDHGRNDMPEKQAIDRAMKKAASSQASTVPSARTARATTPFRTSSSTTSPIRPTSRTASISATARCRSSTCR
jgi:hypothetical protein